jgi:EpsI family protein
MRSLDKRCLGMLALLLGAQLALWAMRPAPGSSIAPPVQRIPLHIAGWRGRDLGPFDRVTLDMLRPDAYLNREYAGADGLPVHLAVICGHRKTTFHSPGFCLLGGGWNIADKSRLQFRPVGGGGPITVNRFLLSREGADAVVLYYYLAGHHRTTASWVAHQAYLAWDRAHRQPAVGALVRVTVPVASDRSAATRRGIDLLRTLHPSLVTAVSI